MVKTKPVALDFKDFEGPIYESIKAAPFDRAAPIPYIFDLSAEGVLKIGWDKTMRRVDSEQAIKKTKVAIREWSEEAVHFRRKLSGDFVYITDETTFEDDLYKLFDSLEVTLITASEASDDQESTKREIPWSLLTSNEDFLVIKLAFDDPNAMSHLEGEPELRVTFWGVDFFKSDNDKPVRFGTSLNWHIFRQISEKD